MNAHRALICALAGNADPRKAEAVLSQAAENIRLEAEALAHFYADSDPEIASRLWYLSGRCAALEAFADCLAVDYQREYADEFVFDPSQDKADESNGADANESEVKP